MRIMYTCPRCCYSTNLKSNFDIHFNRKNVCRKVNDIELTTSVKEMAFRKVPINEILYVNASQRDAIISYNRMSHLNLLTTQHKSNTNSNIIAPDLPILVQYEKLIEHFFPDGRVSEKETLEKKRKRLFSDSIKELDDFQFNASNPKVPNEISIDKIIELIIFLLEIPFKDENNHKKIIFDTVILCDQNIYVYDEEIVENKWINATHFEGMQRSAVLLKLAPIIYAFERNCIYMLYECYDNLRYYDKMVERMKRFYTLMLSLDYDPSILRMDNEYIVSNIINIDKDDPKFYQTKKKVKRIDLVRICKDIFKRVKKNKTESNNGEHNEMRIDKAVKHIAIKLTKHVKEIFQQEYANNSKFMEKINNLKKTKVTRGNDVFASFKIEYKDIL